MPNPKRPGRISPLIRCWLEEEVFAQRNLGVPFHLIAPNIMRVARGQITSAVALPKVSLPIHFRVTENDVRRIYRRALSRFPILTASLHKTENNLRTDLLFAALQPGIQNGDAKSAGMAVKILEHQSRVNGLCASGQSDDERQKHSTSQSTGVAEGRASDTDEDTKFLIETYRAMTDWERRVVEQIMERARARAREIIAKRVAK